MKPSILVLATLILPFAARAQNVPDQHQVVPGERIGRVFLGDSQATVRRRLGKPSGTFALNNGLISELWKSKSPGAYGIHHKLEVVYKGGVAVQIETSNPIFRTKSGLSIDDDPEDWEARLGKASVSPYYVYPQSRYKKGISQQYFDWKRSGLAIETVAKGQGVENNTLIVHRKGVAVIPDSGGVS